MEWARRSSWVDEAVVGRFKQKLQATFDSNAWTEAVEDAQGLIERERKIKRIQLSSLTEEMQNLIVSLKTLSHRVLIQEVEQRYAQMEQEQERLTTELANLDHRKHQQISLDHAYQLFERAIADWDLLTQDERRNVLDLFIERIEVSEYNRSGAMRLTVQWKDATREEIALWHKPHASHWTRENVERLLALFDSGTTQLDIAREFPTLNWYQIFNEVKKHRGMVRFSPAYLGKGESFADFVAHGGGPGKSTSSPWRPDDERRLEALVRSGATQIEIMRVFPYRRWVRIQDRIGLLMGKGTRVKLSGIRKNVSYNEYAGQNINVSSDCNSEIAGGNFLWLPARALCSRARRRRAGRQS